VVTIGTKVPILSHVRAANKACQGAPLVLDALPGRLFRAENIPIAPNGVSI